MLRDAIDLLKDGEDVTDVLEFIWREMPRKPAQKQARATARRMTAEIRDAVKEYVAGNMNVTNRAIGRHFNIDGGRVSEIMQGKYDDLKRGGLT